MGFIKKKKVEIINETKEQPKEEIDEKTKILAKEFNSMIEDYAILNPDHFKEEHKALQHNLLFAIYSEIKKLRKSIEDMANEEK